MADKKGFPIDKSTIRSDEQYQITKKAAEYGCAWCMPEAEQKSPILKEIGTVIVRENVFAKPGRDMYIIHLKRHASFAEVTPDEAEDLFAALNWLVSEYGLQGGGVILRFGDRKLNASSLPDNHFFWSVVAPHGDVPVAETLVKDKSPEKMETREERAKSFK